jgi:hypothetical protein
MAVISRTCLGVTIPLDDGDPAAADLAKAYDALNGCTATAIAQARSVIRTDRAGRGAHKSAPAAPLHPGPAAPAAVKRVASGISLLDNCGLPLVDQSGDFLNHLLTELTPETVQFVGFGSGSDFGRGTLKPLWSGSLLAGLLPLPPIFDPLQSHYEMVSYLTRMNRSDIIWQGGDEQQWYDQFADSLKRYLLDLFGGEFVDRGGNAVSFDLKSITTDLLSFNLKQVSQDTKQIAPQLAGGIITALVEFLGDELFQVPLYSSDALGAYRDYRKSKATTGGSSDIGTLCAAVAAGSIAEADSKRLLNLSTVAGKQLLISGYGGGAVPVAISGLAAGNPIPVSFDLIPLAAGGNSPLIRSGVARLIMAKLAQLDPAYATWSASSPIADQVTKLKGKFTAYKAGVLADNLQGLFDVNSGAVASADGDWGRPIDDANPAGGDYMVDYADLVGKLIAFGASSAEKGVRSLVGGLVRGVAIAALQNEVLAEVVASFAGGLARKLVESVTYTALDAYLKDTTVAQDVKWNSLKILATLLGLIAK